MPNQNNAGISLQFSFCFRFQATKKTQKRKLEADREAGEEGMWSGIRDQMSGGGAGELLTALLTKARGQREGATLE